MSLQTRARWFTPPSSNWEFCFVMPQGYVGEPSLADLTRADALELAMVPRHNPLGMHRDADPFGDERSHCRPQVIVEVAGGPLEQRQADPE